MTLRKKIPTQHRRKRGRRVSDISFEDIKWRFCNKPLEVPRIRTLLVVRRDVWRNGRRLGVQRHTWLACVYREGTLHHD